MNWTSENLYRKSISMIVLWVFSFLFSCYDIHKNENGYYENDRFYSWDGISGEGKLRNNMKDGLWKFFSDDRKLLAEGHFDSGLENGSWEFYYPNEQIKSKGIMENGKRDGVWVFWYPNGIEMSMGEYSNGRRLGRWNFWYSNGNKQEEREYINGKNRLINSWFKDGKPMVIYGNGDYRFYSNEVVMERGRYKDSLAVGQWVFYDQDGRIKSIQTY